MNRKDLLDRKQALDFVKELTGASKRAAPSTFNRWRLRGVAGVKLRTLLINGQYFTKKDWLLEFFEQSAAAKATRNKSHSQGASVKQRKAQREAQELLA